MTTRQFDVTGMTCQNCQRHVEQAVSKLYGVTNADVDLAQNRLLVNYDETLVSDMDIISAVEAAGYGATLSYSAPPPPPPTLNEPAKPKGLRYQKFAIEGMVCSACEQNVQNAVINLDGVRVVTVDLETQDMLVGYNKSRITPEEIIAAVEEVGYGARKISEDEEKDIPENPVAVSDLMRQTFTVSGMTCTKCEEHVQNAVSRLIGVSSAKADFASGSLEVEYDDDFVSVMDIIKAVESAGYTVENVVDPVAAEPAAPATAACPVPEPEPSLTEQKFDVTGMTCASCSAHVEKAVGKLAGVDKVAVNLMRNNMMVTYDPARESAESIIKAVEKAGYGAAAVSALPAQATLKPQQGMVTGQKYNVTGMTCASCSGHVEKAVRKLNGVTNVAVNLLGNSMNVDYDAGLTTPDDIIKAVNGAGYGASLAVPAQSRVKSAAQAAGTENNAELKSMRLRFWVSLIFLLPLFYISMGHMFGWPLPEVFHGTANAMTFALSQFILVLPIMYVNRKYYTVGFKTLLKGAPTMDALIAIGSMAAAVYGVFALFQIGYGLGHGDLARVREYSMDLYFESAAMILTLVTLGKFLETRSKGKTSDAIAKLINLAPKTALVERGGVETEIPAEEVMIGDIVIIKPGQSIPVDGVVTEGNSSVDEAALTGESLPVYKEPGVKVMSGTINKNGFFKFRAAKVGDDTTLSQIIALMENAGASKVPIARLADKVSSIFVPVVIVIALAAFAVWLYLGASFVFALSIGIAVLVISCPCALGLATPVAVMVGTGKGAENGILVKSGPALETLHTIDTVILDKTGTITEGKPVVTDIISSDGLSEAELLALAASIEKPSEHPLAEAIVAKAEEMGLEFSSVTDFKAVTGSGLQAKIKGRQYYAGNLKFLKSLNIINNTYISRADELAEAGKTPLYFANGNTVLGLIAVADVIKPSSRKAVEQLKAMGIEVCMITGDNHKTADAIKKELDIDYVMAEVMPQDKAREVQKFQQKGKKVAMVGDGINDAPALAEADVGMAIGAGTDIAIESADIVLMKSDLLDAVTAVQLSKAVIRNIKQNLFWAFFYNCIGIPLAAGVLYPWLGLKLNPMFGAAAMSISSICVVSNALRLRWFKPAFVDVKPAAEAALDKQA